MTTPPVAPIRAVALDIDGTLAGGDHRVSPRSTAALQALQAAAVFPILITGRTENAAISIAEAAALTTPIISCNGAIVTEAGSKRRLRESTFTPAQLQPLIQWIHETHGLQLFLWTADNMHAETMTAAAQQLGEINQQDVVIQPLDAIDVSTIVKIMIGGDRDRLDQISADLADSFPYIHRSLDQFFEGSPPGASKWEALNFVLDELAVPAGQCLGIADGDTDVGWLSQIGHPVAVSNARPAVLAIATLVIGHHADDSVGDFLQNRFQLPV